MSAAEGQYPCAVTSYGVSPVEGQQGFVKTAIPAVSETGEIVAVAVADCPAPTVGKLPSQTLR